MSNKSSNSGMSICGVLFLIFFVLKICNLITLSWLWVFAPIWAPILLILVAAGVMKLMDESNKKNKGD